MKPLNFRRIIIASTVVGTLVTASAFTPMAHAAAKQYVVVVAEGVSPQVLDLGKSYLRKSDDDAELSTSFDGLIAGGQPATVATDAISQMQGILEIAENSGYKTGLVTTGDITAVAPLFYTLNGDDALTSAAAKYDFLAGGGRAKLGADADAKTKAAGGNYLMNAESLDTEITGRVLAAQSDSDLDFSIDRNPAEQAGLAELATLAMDTLGAGDSPFVLVVHDTLLKKALDSKDSPAWLEQFRELDAILADASTRRDDNPNLNLAVLMTGSAATPRFASTALADQQNALFVLSNLPLSYAGAGRALQGADAEQIAAFSDTTDGQYKGWKVSANDRERLLNGTLEPEAAIRASYEPALQLNYDGPVANPVAYTLGFAAPNGLVDALKAAVAVPAK